ncbi:baseplate J/gp47 family protein [Patescibacteria group bacterium]|nr:baseplate J/gp47 family protein [Patescibacteria group bacterium]
MTQKWNLQDIRPIEPKTRPTSRPPQSIIQRPAPVIRDSVDDTESIIIVDGNKKQRNYYVWGGALLALVIGGSLAMSVIFSETTLTVKPEFRQPQVNAEFEGFRERRENALTYEILTIEATKELQVKATGEKKVTEQTKGTLEITKTTAGAERLIKNTRFKSPEGLVFRIQESVVVPGAVEKDGKLVPGTIRAEVFAESAGEAYNLPAGTKFSVPGFEESGLTDLFKSISATNPNAFAGGFDGQQFIIDETELGTARQNLQLELRNSLLERIKNERPSGFVAFEGSYAFTYNELPAVNFGGDLVTIKEQAVLQVPLFKAPELAAFIAAQTVPTYNKAPVRIESYEGMLFTYSDPKNSSTVIANMPSLKFNLVGKPRIIWEYDEDKLRSDLAGKPKTAVAAVMTGYAGIIKSSQVSMKPFYRRSFPENGEDIRIIEVLEE